MICLSKDFSIAILLLGMAPELPIAHTNFADLTLVISKF